MTNFQPAGGTVTPHWHKAADALTERLRVSGVGCVRRATIKAARSGAPTATIGRQDHLPVGVAAPASASYLMGRISARTTSPDEMADLARLMRVAESLTAQE
ncbi:hypothetical protein [Streptosporangium lutulentum]|uniref:Uncharacterized protein n=1 Tax=Streptosporangium lutulentum TaxID=1461250 RepID=A0ABT9QUB9_9ACTN|nr:hypothetical protein [Streptosporangium lutulentum]MDP9850360.1 hypothetical protein [Streptosporangium lutulentum]